MPPGNRCSCVPGFRGFCVQEILMKHPGKQKGTFFFKIKCLKHMPLCLIITGKDPEWRVDSWAIFLK